MSGRAPYGFKAAPIVMDGIRTKQLVADPERAEQVRLMFEMYSKPETSFGDITRYFTERGITFNNGELQRATVSVILRNPVYAQADLEIYGFFKSQGAAIVNDAADFAGTNGCYLYQGRDAAKRKYSSLKDQILVIAPHEGLVSSEVWLACRKRLMGNTSFGSTRKAKNTWLAGKIKCGRCGAALMYTYNAERRQKQYFRCRRHMDNKTCEGVGGVLEVPDVEESIYGEMVKKMSAFQTLTGGNPARANPKLTALKVELAQVEAEIEKLIDTLTGANRTLISYANNKIEELDTKKQSLVMAIADMSAEAVSPEKIERISDYLSNWDSIDFEDKRLVVDGLISQIKATSESVQIEWKI
jgi:hypothetical protein